ncbi:MAG: pilus assembly protein PilM [Filifactoraceae bacterium]
MSILKKNKNVKEEKIDKKPFFKVKSNSGEGKVNQKKTVSLFKKGKEEKKSLGTKKILGGKSDFFYKTKHRKGLMKNSEMVISIDFDTNKMKFVYGKIQNRKIYIENMFLIELQKDWYSNGFVNIPAQELDSIVEVLRKNGINTKNAICTAKSSNILKREIVIPNINQADIDSLLKYEMGQYLPIESSDAVIEYIEIEKFIDEEVEKLKLLVAVIPENIVKSMLNFVNGLKLLPYAMDESTNSIEKLINFNEGFINEDYVLDESIAIIEINDENSNFIVFKNGKYKFNTVLEFGYKDLRSLVADGLDISGHDLEKKTNVFFEDMIEKAYNKDEEYLKDNGIKGVDSFDKINNYFIKLFFNKMEAFVGEVSRSIKYYSMQDESNEINHIYIYGGGLFEINMSKFLEKKLNKPTRRIDFIDSVVLNEKDKDKVSSFLNAIGAVIRLEV